MVSGFIDPENDPSKMWQERPYLDGASKDPSVRVIQNGLVTRNDAPKKIACPNENEIYVAELLNWRLQKITMKPAARTSTAGQ